MTNNTKTAEDDELESTQPPADVVAFNELRSCADLFRLHREGVLEIQPQFQREVVWQRPAQSIFIDSLIKQLPIPSMCFSLDYVTQKWQVVDGLQRMTSIVSFLNEDKEWRLSRLSEIDPKISGKTNLDLKDGDENEKILYRRIQNLSLPITVIRCDQSKSNHSEYLFSIFHRLNAGGARLNHQEIRNCIFSGSLNEHLRGLDKDRKWTFIKNLIPGKGTRFRSIELILRFFALSEVGDQYDGNMARFLNSYMRENRNASKKKLDQLTVNLFESVKILQRALNHLKVSKISSTIVETALIGIASNIDFLSTVNDVILARMLVKLMDSYVISSEESRSDTTAKDKVRQRISESKKIFS